MDYLHSKDLSYKIISYIFYLYLVFHICIVRFDVMKNFKMFYNFIIFHFFSLALRRMEAQQLMILVHTIDLGTRAPKQSARKRKNL